MAGLGNILNTLVFSLVFLMFAGCSDDETVSVNKSDDWCVLSKVEGFSGTWKPKDEVIPKLIFDAKAYLENLQKNSQTDVHQKSETAKILKQWADYRCQVVGYTKSGKKMIKFNFFPKSGKGSDGFSYWRKSLVSVMDGGAGFWQVDYDVTLGTFIDFASNGYA